MRYEECRLGETNIISLYKYRTYRALIGAPTYDERASAIYRERLKPFYKSRIRGLDTADIKKKNDRILREYNLLPKKG